MNLSVRKLWLLKACDAKVILDKIELSLSEAVLPTYEKAKPVIASKAWLQRTFLIYNHLRGNERSRGRELNPCPKTS